MATAVTPPNFIFTSEETIGDLVRVASALEAAGHRPSLRFVRYNGNADGVAVEFDLKDHARACGEMSGDAGRQQIAPYGVDADDQPRHSANCNDGYPEDCLVCTPLPDSAVSPEQRAYDERREEMREAERDAYYGDLGVETV